MSQTKLVGVIFVTDISLVCWDAHLNSVESICCLV